MPYQKLDKAIKKVANQTKLSETPAFNHVRNTIMATISALPYVGGPLSILIDKYIPDKKQERLLNFIKSLESSIANIHESLDYDYIQTDEFAFMFEQTFKSVADSHQKEKLECYKAIILNTLKVPQNISFEEKELYLSLVNKMTAFHIKVLGMLDQIINREIDNPLTVLYRVEITKEPINSEKPEQAVFSKDFKRKNIVTDQDAILGELYEQLANYPGGTILLVIEDLEKFGIIQRIEEHDFKKEENSFLQIKIPSILQTKLQIVGLGNLGIFDLDFSKPHLLLTNFGKRLISFLKEPS